MRSVARQQGQGSLIVISGASGSGKGRLIKKMHGQHGFAKYPTLTTRDPRQGEIDGYDYRFTTVSSIMAMIKADELIEWECVHEQEKYYATPKEPLLPTLAEGARWILEIDVRGYRKLRRYNDGALCDSMTSFFLKVPLDVTVRRILEREPRISKNDLCARIGTAYDELKAAPEYDYVLDHPDGATDEVAETVFRLNERRMIERDCVR